MSHYRNENDFAISQEKLPPALRIMLKDLVYFIQNVFSEKITNEKEIILLLTPRKHCFLTFQQYLHK